jgi:hypothetical protein
MCVGGGVVKGQLMSERPLQRPQQSPLVVELLLSSKWGPGFKTHGNPGKEEEI